MTLTLILVAPVIAGVIIAGAAFGFEAAVVAAGLAATAVRLASSSETACLALSVAVSAFLVSSTDFRACNPATLAGFPDFLVSALVLSSDFVPI